MSPEHINNTTKSKKNKMQFQDLTQKYRKCMLLTRKEYFQDLSYLKNASKLQ